MPTTARKLLQRDPWSSWNPWSGAGYNNNLGNGHVPDCVKDGKCSGSSSFPSNNYVKPNSGGYGNAWNDHGNRSIPERNGSERNVPARNNEVDGRRGGCVGNRATDRGGCGGRQK